jgi:hypothetical protein
MKEKQKPTNIEYGNPDSASEHSEAVRTSNPVAAMEGRK